MGRPDYVTRALARALKAHPEVIQDDLAAALDRDRSAVSHMLRPGSRQHVPADELEVWCDVLGTIEPLEAIARRLGYRLVPQERAAAPLTVERHSWALFGQVSRFGEALAAAIQDGRIDEQERRQLRQLLVGARQLIEGLLARLPEGGA